MLAKCNQKTTNNNQPTLYIHWDYHPNRLQLKDLQQFNNETLYGHDNLNQMTVTLSRPNNLQNSLSQTKLAVKTGECASDLMKQIHTDAEK